MLENTPQMSPDCTPGCHPDVPPDVTGMSPINKKRRRKPKKKALDRRTRYARRHRELVAAFAHDLGGNLSAADKSFIDNAATIAVACEQIKDKQLAAEPIDLDELVRLTNALTRVRKELGARANDKPEQTHEELLDELYGKKPGHDE
jgi:hypothetical protein